MRRCAGCGFVDYARHDGCPVCGGRDWRVVDGGPRLRDVFLYIRVCSPARVDDLFDRRRCLGLLSDYGIGDHGSLWLVGQAFDAQAVGLLSSSRDGSGLRKMGLRLRNRHVVRLDEADVEALVDAYRVLLGLDADGRQDSQTATPAPAAVPVVQADAAATPEECFERGAEYYRKRDYVQAFHWYMKAAQQGHPTAQCSIGLMYYCGLGLDKDYAQAFHWYMKCYRGLGLDKGYAQALHWYMKAAEQGNFFAQTNLGCVYLYGEGVDKDDVQAFHWYMKAAQQGHANAQYGIGFMYEYGEGVDKDDVQAFHWYMKAAQQGHAFAQCCIGEMYRKGEGIDKDDMQAFHWYMKAAQQGDATAQNNIGVMYEDGVGVDKDLAQAEFWYRKAAEQGDIDAYRGLDRLRQR